MGEKREQYPLSWPENWPRTRPQDQRLAKPWKKTANYYRDELSKELERKKASVAIISTNVPLTLRHQMSPGIEPRDVGVAIYFTTTVEEDFRWQDALGIHSPAPTDDEINGAFRKLAAQYHPDKVGGGDLEMFRALTRHRDNALRWAHRATNEPEHVIACDVYGEVRWNLAAIAFTLKALRQIDRYGTSSVLERAFKGLMALAANAGPDAEGV